MTDSKLLFAFYGDDFTGSTDALEWLCHAGLKSILFLEPPTVEELKQYPGLQAFGVAGATRALNPEEMEEALIPAFERMKESGVKYVHYKVCSTFDSSPTTGSIGKAIDVGVKIFESRYVPVIQSAPVLGRYLFFGNLFARMGIGSNGEVFRLDRHPSMRCHPTTPADESDLRLHLAKQTKKKIGLVPIVDVIADDKAIKESINKNLAEGAEVVFFDALENHHLKKIATLLEDEASYPFLIVGSSGVEIAFGNHFQSKFVLHEPSWQRIGKREPLLVVCGSCSPVTTKQIHWAMQNGFEEVMIDMSKLFSESSTEALEVVFQKALKVLEEKKSLIIHSNSAKRINTVEKTAKKLGTALGNMAKRLVEQTPVKRLVVAGGDTSSYAARALGIEAVEMIAPLVPGAPLCKVHAPNSSMNGIEINFKGGQVGDENYFGLLRDGTT